MGSLWGPFEPFDVRQRKLEEVLAESGITPDSLRAALATITPDQIREAVREADRRAAVFRGRPRTTCPCPHCAVLD